MHWQESVKRKRAHLHSLIPPEWRIPEANIPSVIECPNVVELVPTYLDTTEIRITESSASDILEAIRSGADTTQEVVSAFCHRASLAHQFTNCLSEINFEDALRRAKELDDYQRKHKRTSGPLHGLPVSLMDRLTVDGLESACGFVSWLGKPTSAANECALVVASRRLGAIPFCKTNIPMSMMMGDTTNNVNGTTVNPYNRNLSAGGASGGEGALIGLKGSPLGFSIDMAGSSRIPCAFNNIFGLKTSEGRLAATGIETVLTGLDVAAGSVGLMASHKSTLLEGFKALLETKPWEYDIDVVELPWRDSKYDGILRRSCAAGRSDGKLVFAMMSTDSHVHPHPPIQRALRHVRQALLKRGYEVIDWMPEGHAEAVENLFKIFGSTSAKTIRDAIDASGEPPISQLKSWYEEGDTECSTTSEFWELCRERHEYRLKYADLWTSTASNTRTGRQIDGIIAPVAPTVAIRQGEFQYYAYTAFANVLDFAAAAFPVTFANMDLDHAEWGVKYANALDASVRETYRSEEAHGMPVGLQVVCPRHQEERALGLLGSIMEALKAEDQPT